MNIEDKFEKMLETQTAMLVDLTAIRKDTERNTENIEYHIKRTDLLEKKVNCGSVREWAVVIGVLGSFAALIAKIMGVY